MRKKIKLVLKILSILLGALLLFSVVQFYRFSSPKSDKKIYKEFSENNKSVFINHREFDDFKYRVLTTRKEIDTSLTILVFVHGSIGSAMDFKKYLFDEDLNAKANLISYDRVGYGIHQTGNVQESIDFESRLLQDLLKKLDKGKTVLVGYSYGAPIALELKDKYQGIVLLAPAVYSKVEPMPWALNLYRWKATKWLLPKIWKAASKEKLSHKKDLQIFENTWNENPSKVVSVHGTKDWIVPIENSFFLKEMFSPQQFELVTLEGVGHGLVWSQFDAIKQHILQQLK